MKSTSAPQEQERDALDKAIQLHQAGRFDCALKLYRNIIKNNPTHFDSLQLAGICLGELGKYEEGVSLIKQAIQIEPNQVVLYLNFAFLLQKQNLWQQACEVLMQAISLQQQTDEIYFQLGRNYNFLQQVEKCIASYQKCIEINPNHYKAFTNLANIYVIQGKVAQAKNYYIQAIKVCSKALKAKQGLAQCLLRESNPTAVVELLNTQQEPYLRFLLGCAYRQLGQTSKAEQCFNQILRSEVDNAEVYYQLGLIYKSQQKYSLAIEHFESAISKNSSLIHATAELFHTKSCIANWENREQLSEQLNILNQAAMVQQQLPEEPLMNVARCMDYAINSQVAQAWANAASRQNNAAVFAYEKVPVKNKENRIHVGYLSSDFHDHATSQLIKGLIKLHNRKKFIISLYSYGPEDHSLIRQQLKQLADRFIDIQSIDNLAAANLIHKDQVNILIDLKGYTQNMRLGISALRPAPIQINYLGFPGTSGAKFFDYIILDNTICPVNAEQYFSEKCLFLQGSYQATDNRQKIDETMLSREELGIPKNAFVFSAFHQFYKIEPVMFQRWMAILNAVPHSVLWLLLDNQEGKIRLRQHAEEAGIDPSRLIFAPKWPKAQHLNRCQVADIGLDTRIYNGHTTTSDMLWAGVPVLTLYGKHFASRVSASILTANALPELICNTLADYQQSAIELATEEQKYLALKKKVKSNRDKAMLFNTEAFVEDFEQKLQNVWHNYLIG